MIVSRPSKLKFSPLHKEDGRIIFPGKENMFIELLTIFGKLIYRIELKGKDLIMERPNANVGYRFRGQWDYLKIHRNPDPLIDSFNVQLYCSNCGENIYKLTGKLPLLFKIKTDFYVEKDTSTS